MDVLFLSVSAGGGHIKAAEALKQTIDLRFPGSRTLIVDTFKYINPVIDKLIVGSYLNTVKNTPQIYGKLYEMSESGYNLHDFSKSVNKLLSYGIKSLIDDFKPAVIVCTHFFPLQMMSNLKKKNKVKIPVIAVLTDFVTHTFWHHENIDAYIVAHEHMKYEMSGKGIPEDIIYPFGIPVSEGFLKKKNKEAILEELDLEDKLTILLMGGSLGYGEIRDVFISLLKHKKDLQVIVVAGNNQKLKKQLEKYLANSDKKAKIIGYTDKISDLMDISDLIITKPGGMTISEALIKELPIIFISPIPGQEERNANFLTNNGAAARILSSDNINSVISQIIENPVRISHMKEMAGLLSRPHAVEHIIGLMDKLAKTQVRDGS